MGKKTGGRKVASGGDVCVYDPAVSCEGEDQRTPDSVSRIIQAGTGDHDIEIEGIISARFPELVRGGYVTVHTKSCTPDFKDVDFDPPAQQWNGRYACTAKINPDRGVDKNYVNLLTPKREGNVGLLARIDYTALKDAFVGAIALVPDDGPWVIHGDLHLLNVLVYNANDGIRHTSLADWGRSFVVENPNDLDSIKAGLLTFLHRWNYSQKTNYAEASTEFFKKAKEGEIRWHNVAPKYLWYAIYTAIRDNDLETLRSVIRGWNVLALAVAIDQRNDGNFSSICLKNTNQATLLNTVNELFNLNITVPRHGVVEAPVEAPAPAVSGGRRHRSKSRRKTRRTSKKRSTRKIVFHY